jgi:pimeloyl-ACP methyl ester carboxylesterase
MFRKPELTLEDIRRATADFFCNRNHPEVDVIARRRLDNLSEPHAYRYAKDNAMGQVERRAADLGAPEYVSRIRAPTFLLHGRDERWFYPDEHRAALTEAAMQVALMIPDCTLTMLPNCGHWPQVERADRYNALLLESLASLS